MELWSDGSPCRPKLANFPDSGLQHSNTPTTPRPYSQVMTMADTPHRNLRVLLAKVGLDGHDRGLKIVARALRDAGVEVIYLGIHNSAAEIVRAALQEDVDGIGISIHSAAHRTLFKEVSDGLKKNRASGVAVFAGGIIPAEDFTALKRLGVRKIFGPGTPLEEIVGFVKSLKGRRQGRALRAQNEL